MARRLPAPLRPLVPVLAGAALLAGCGGGGTPISSADATGVLSDSPVKGVSYRRNGTDAGQTDILGQFRYRPGEAIEFRIGKLVLGTVTGAGNAMTVTPLELAQALAVADRPDRVTNLLVLLQALDVDGDPANGIDIPAAAVAQLDEDAEIAKLDLNADPAIFQADTDLDAIVTAINNAGGTATKPTTAAALDHFRQQFLSALAGTYLGTSRNSNPVAVRFLDSGAYLLGETRVTGGSSGLERGSISWDAATGTVTINAPDQDTNADWGFSYIRELYRLTAAKVEFRVDGGDLVVTQRDGSGTSSYRLPRHFNSGSSLAGTWAKDNAGSLQQLHLFMRDDGVVMAVNPGADKTLLGRTNAGCNRAGVEFGNYTVASGSIFFSNISAIDTDGCGGLHDGNLVPDYLAATNAHVSPLLNTVNYAVSMRWFFNTSAGTQQATFYRPDNTVAP